MRLEGFRRAFGFKGFVGVLRAFRQALWDYGGLGIKLMLGIQGV